MKIRNLLLAFFVISSFALTIPKKTSAGSYSCNCRNETYDCWGSEQQCTDVCTGGYWTLYGASWVYYCVSWGQDCQNVPVLIRDGCSNRVCETCCNELNTNPSQPSSISITAEVPVTPYQCNPHNCNCRNETYDCNLKVGETCTQECVAWERVWIGLSYVDSCTDWDTTCVDEYDWVRDGCSNRVCDTCYDTCTTDTQDVNIPNCSNPLNATLESGATVSLPALSQPATSTGVGYQFRFYDSTNTLVHTMESTNRTQTVPDWLINNINTGERYKIAGLYYTVNECDGDKKYSTPIEGCISGNQEPDPPCTGADCNPNTFITNLGTDSTSTKGCSSSDYAGQEVNNPWPLQFNITDQDGADEIEAFMLWFSSDTNTPATTEIVGTYSGTSTNDAAIMIKKNGDWSNPTIYALNNDNTWAPSNNVEDTSGEEIISISNVTTVQTTDVQFDLQIEFTGGTSGLAGNYNIYAAGIDTTMITGTTITHGTMTNIFDFGIDLVNPTLENMTKTPVDIETMTIGWDASDLESSILTTIVNGYVDSDTRFPIALDTLTINSPISPPDEDQRGLWADIGTTALQIAPPTTEVDLDIGTNDSGSIYVVPTIYDQGCNSSSDEEEISLQPWISTQGGMFYSKEAVNTDATDVSTTDLLIDIFQRFDRTTISHGTEVLTTRTEKIYQIIHPDLNAVTARRVYDSNNQKTHWFNYIKEKLPTNLTTLPTYDSNCSGNCIFNAGSDDITIPESFNCSGNTLFITEGNITISPKQGHTAPVNNTTGCIFISKEDITITNTGHTASAAEIGYDYLEGFFIAEDQIIIQTGTTDEDKKYGLEIEGSLISLGRDQISGQAIENNRSMKVYNAISPSLLVNYHPKYSKVSEDLVGQTSEIFIQEIAGFKN